MADDEHETNGDSDEANQNNDEAAQKKAARFDNATAGDLEKITDYAEEKEIISTDEFQGAMTIIGDQRNKEIAEKMAKEKELLKVIIKKEDVDLIVKETLISQSLAERTLREHCGNVVNALIALTE
ncbi:huntingtin-interacting protein K [Macrosteles quadrilineatus]|uniref:huntingtin-interacting protein K n=1 Tax=Macrosteles quadrilineatus TaxID=74068 RepID=UPI0023E1D87E|nr:huntingtin-interacting protein K [Macrosteles quadrilineatus]